MTAVDHTPLFRAFKAVPSVLAVTAAFAALPAAAAHAAPGDLTRYDRTATADSASANPVLSASGQFVAFLSSENLTGTAPGGKRQLFVRERGAGTVMLASASVAGLPANADIDAGDGVTSSIDISADGRYVVFGTRASNLSAGDVNGKADVFRKDLKTGAVELISFREATYGDLGGLGDGDSSDPSISGDGSRVVYVTDATNLLHFETISPTGVYSRVPDTNGAADIAFWNSSGTQLVSASATSLANGPTRRPTLSADGNSLAFEVDSATTNLYPNDTNGLTDVLVQALSINTQPMKLIPISGGVAPDLSGNGRFVAFQTTEPLTDGDANAVSDIYRRDVTTDEVLLASARNGLAVAGNGQSTGASISADGTRVAFNSDATNLDGGDDNGVRDVFTRTVESQTTARASQAGAGVELAAGSASGAISGNGGVVAFTSSGSFVGGEADSAIYLYGKQLTPTDTTAPTIAQLNCFPGYKGIQTTVTGHVSPDPSGLIGGSQVTGGYGVAFLDGEPGINSTLSASDGAGNVTTVKIPTTICDSARPKFKPIKPKVTAVRITGRLVRATYATSTRGTAKVWVERLVGRKGKKAEFVRVTQRRSFSAQPSTRSTVTVPMPKAKGTYRIVLVTPFIANPVTHTLGVDAVTTRIFRR